MKLPMEYMELFDGEAHEKWVEASNKRSPEKKKAALLNILSIWLLQNFEPDENLKEQYESFTAAFVGDLTTYATNPGQLTILIYGKGKEKGCRFLPLQLPHRNYSVKKSKTAKKEQTKVKEEPVETPNPFKLLDTIEEGNEES